MSGTEIWKPIPSTEGQYEVSDLGRIRCTYDYRTQRSVMPPRLLTPTPDERGYLSVGIRINGHRKPKIQLQRCMLEAFVGPAPSSKHFALFRNGRRDDFRLDNVFWGTAQDRNEIRRMHGTYKERPHQMIDGEVCYQCIYCKEWLPRDRFYKLKGGTSALGNRLSTCGIASECKRCSNEKRSARRRRGGA